MPQENSLNVRAAPPPHPVEWLAVTRYEPGASSANGHTREVRVVAQTWFRARELAVVALGVGRECLSVTRWDEVAREIETPPHSGVRGVFERLREMLSPRGGAV